jgi:hypothetical protein
LRCAKSGISDIAKIKEVMNVTSESLCHILMVAGEILTIDFESLGIASEDSL